MNQTLMVLGKDVRATQNWIQNWGIRLKNTQLVPISTEDAVPGYDDDTTFYVLLKGSEKNRGRDSVIASPYREVLQKVLEEKLKKVRVNRAQNQ